MGPYPFENLGIQPKMRSGRIFENQNQCLQPCTAPNCKNHLILLNIDDKLPRDSNGVTPLHIAAERKHLEIFDLFLENIKIHPLDNQGRSPADIMRSHSENFLGLDKKTSALLLLFTFISGIFIGLIFMHK